MASSPQAVDPLLGRTLGGKFRIDRLLGEGGMGRVYLAEQTNLSKQVAIKVLHGQMVGDASIEKRFLREAKSASALAHPNILQIIDFGGEEGVLFIAMELLSGRSLRDALKREWPLGDQRVGHIVGQVLGALDEAHAKNIVHRDLKPENVMLIDVRGETDFVKVCDFGIAKALSERDGEGGGTLTAAGMICGTPEFMSPEQARGDQLDGRADLYSVACMLYQLVVGQLPFRAETALGILTKQLTETPVAPSLKLPGGNISPALDEVILRGLSKDPAERYQTAADMRDELYAAVGHARASGARAAARRPSGPTGAALDPLGATGMATPSVAAVAAAAAANAAAATPSSVTMTSRRSNAPFIIGGSVALIGLGIGGVIGLTSRKPAPVQAMVDTPAPKAHPRDHAIAGPAADPTVSVAPSVAVVTVSQAQPSPAVAVAPPSAAPSAPAAPAVGKNGHRQHHDGKTVAAPAVAPTQTQAPTQAPPLAAAHGFAAVFAEGDQLFKSGTLDGALAKYLEAARLEPRDAKTQRQIGKVYNRQGNRERAVPYFKRYLELAPDASDAAFIRAIVDGN